jgi:hypothetical protein
MKERDYPDAIVEFPFHTSIRKFETKIGVTNFFNITSSLQMFIAFVLALVTPILLLFSRERYLMLYTYSSFYWYWTYFSLINRKLNSIWLSNHYDRWVKLVDGLPGLSKKIIVQHGQLEYNEIETGKIYFPSFSKKLRNISKVYTIDDISRNHFLEMIDNESLVFEKIKSKLKIIEWPATFNSKFKILILGHQNDFIFHNALIEWLERSKLFDLAYKTHPQQTIENALSKSWLITVSNVLPTADIVISYGSSLDNEIKQLLPNSRIINYGFNEKFEFNETINSIEKKLFNLLKI